MFRATINGKTFFNTEIPGEGLALSEAKLDLEVGKAGSFVFKIHPSNIAYGQLQKFKSYVSLYRDDRLIFSGRVLDGKKDFYNEETITCEGLLALFNDSVMRPFSFQGTVTEFVTLLVNSHNSQVSEDKKFTVGNITVTDPNDYIARGRDGYNSTMTLLDDTVKTLGGYFVVRPTETGLALDYLVDFTAKSTQAVNFGENLLNITKESPGGELITALLPLGADYEEEQEDGTVVRKKTTITSVNDGKDYVQNDAAVAKYGFILGIHEWQDVTRPENLKTKATEWLNAAAMEKTTINIEADDMAKAGTDIDSFLCGEYISIKSDVHNIDDDMLIKKQSMDLLAVGSSKIIVGNTVSGYVESSVSNENDYTKVVEKIEANYVTNQTVTAVKKDSLSAMKFLYTQNDSPTVAPTTGWSEDFPVWEDGKYIWQKAISVSGTGLEKELSVACITGAKGDTGADGQQGEKGDTGAKGDTGEQGDPGKGISSKESQYYLSTSDTEPADGEWLNTMPEWQPQKFLWAREVITWTDGTTTETPAILAGAVNSANETAQSAKDKADQNANDVSATVLALNSRIDQLPESIELEVSKTYATKDQVSEQAARISVMEDSIEQTVKSVDGILTTVKVTENGVEIGKSDSEIKSVQDNDSYQFVDKSNNVILEMNTKGVNAPAVNVSKQLKIGESWAIRHGEYISGKGYNLNDVWIGG